jgi:hypothetical protein
MNQNQLGYRVDPDNFVAFRIAQTTFGTLSIRRGPRKRCAISFLSTQIENYILVAANF